MSEELEKLSPVTILVTSFNRLNLLKKTIDLINERTFYPYRIIVIDSNSTDGSVSYLKNAKVNGKIFDHLLLPDNLGQSRALNEGFKVMEDWENNHRRPSNDFFITTNEDIYPPMLSQENCWLTQMIDILKRHEPEYGGICMRIQRTPRNEIDEGSEIIPCYKGFPSVFRLMRRSDFRELGNRPFGRLMKWDSNTSGDKFKLQIKKKFGFTTHIYADHAGFMTENRGYLEGFKDYFTYAENKINIQEEKPYPDIDPLTNEPLEIHHHSDTYEHQKRKEYKELIDGRISKNEVTVIILTSHRLDGFKKLVDSIKKNNTDIGYDILVVVDNDDTVAYDYCLENGIECLLSNNHRDFVAQANLAVYCCKTRYFVVLSDDTEVIEQNVLSRSLNIFKEKFKDDIGLLAFNDGIQKGRLFTMGMSSKKFVEVIGGYLYYPEYKHYGGDREVSRLAREMGVYHYDESLNVIHNHPGNHGEKDETYMLSQNKFWHQDQELKKRRQDINLLEVKNNYHF
jgi:glycosyltransferase involved in cell wall biosynthesis